MGDKTMMYCKHCGNEIEENATYCQHCGTKIEVYVESNKPLPKNENSAWGILAIIFSALGGSGLGLLFSIIGLCTYKTRGNKARAWIGLGLYIGWTVIIIVLNVLAYVWGYYPIPYIIIEELLY